MAVSVLTSVTNDVQNGKFKAVLTAAASPGASSVFCGFKPRLVTLQQIGGTADATWFSQWAEGMTDGHRVAVTHTGVGSLATANGIQAFDGTQADRTDQATGSPVSSGQGFLVGSGCVATSIVYLLTAER